MKKCLPISVPTFNCAELLDWQLQRLTTSIQGWEEQCEIILANDCSTDQTEIFAQPLKLGYSREVCQQAFSIGFQDRGYWMMLIKFLIQKPILGWQTWYKTVRTAWSLYV
jgi:hypothetical protein